MAVISVKLDLYCSCRLKKKKISSVDGLLTYIATMKNSKVFIKALKCPDCKKIYWIIEDKKGG